MQFLGHLVCPICNHDAWVINQVIDDFDFRNLDVSCERCGLHCLMCKGEAEITFVPQDLANKKKNWENILSKI